MTVVCLIRGSPKEQEIVRIALSIVHWISIRIWPGCLIVIVIHIIDMIRRPSSYFLVNFWLWGNGLKIGRWRWIMLVKEWNLPKTLSDCRVLSWPWSSKLVLEHFESLRITLNYEADGSERTLCLWDGCHFLLLLHPRVWPWRFAFSFLLG